MNLKTYMSDSEKNMLLVCLCSYLPYGLKCLYCDVDNEVKIGDLKAVHFNDDRIIIDNVSIDYSGCDTLGVTPYLFPMSSMTEEQKKELQSLMIRDSYNILYHTIESFDYLYKNHIDVRGLIPMGLAIDCTKLKTYLY